MFVNVSEQTCEKRLHSGWGAKDSCADMSQICWKTTGDNWKWLSRKKGYTIDYWPWEGHNFCQWCHLHNETFLGVLRMRIKNI